MSVNQQKGSAASSRDTAVTSGSTAYSFGSNDALAKMLAIAAALRQRNTPPDEDLKQEVKNSAFPTTNAAVKNSPSPNAAVKNEQVPTQVEEPPAAEESVSE